MAQRMAAPNRPKYKPAFTVEKLDGKRDHTLIVYNGKGEKEEKLVKEDAGFLVRFPIKGASMRVRDEKELKRLGFDQTIPVINEDGDDDEALTYLPNSVTASVAG